MRESFKRRKSPRGATFDKLDALTKAGAAVTSVSLDDVSSLEQLREQLGLDAAPLFAVDAEGSVSFVHADEPWPKSGTLAVLAPP